MALELVVVACVCNIYCAVAVTQSHMVTRWLAVLAWPFHVDMGLKSRSNSRQGQAGYTTHRISKPYLPYPCQCPNKFGSTFFFSPWNGPAPSKFPHRTSHSSIERFKKYAPKGMTSLWVQLSPSRMELPLLRPRNLIAKWGSSIQGEDLGDGWVTGRSELGKWGILGYCKWLIPAHSSSFQLPFLQPLHGLSSASSYLFMMSSDEQLKHFKACWNSHFL
jgi:hypothetical protein